MILRICTLQVYGNGLAKSSNGGLLISTGGLTVAGGMQISAGGATLGSSLVSSSGGLFVRSGHVGKTVLDVYHSGAAAKTVPTLQVRSDSTAGTLMNLREGLNVLLSVSITKPIQHALV